MKESIHNIRSSVDCFILWVKRLVSLSITSHNICDGHKKGHKTGCLWENHSHHLLLRGWNTSIYEAPKDLFGLIETLYSVEVQVFSFWLQHPCCLGKNWLKVDIVWTNFRASDYLPTPWTGHGVETALQESGSKLIYNRQLCFLASSWWGDTPYTIYYSLLTDIFWFGTTDQQKTTRTWQKGRQVRKKEV